MLTDMKAEIERLKAAYDKECDRTGEQWDELRAENAALLAVIEGKDAALKYYADHNEWIDFRAYGTDPRDGERHLIDSHLDYDNGGDKARAALALTPANVAAKVDVREAVIQKAMLVVSNINGAEALVSALVKLKKACAKLDEVCK